MDIVINSINKSYGENRVLNSLDAVIESGRITCLMGQSGAGKTTLLNILMGFEKADSGEIKNLPAKKSVVFQENRLCESFSALTNIKIANDNLNDQTITEHLEKVGLGDAVHQKVSTLSGGMKRRVTLVRAVLAEKEILFLDEPFKGLDDNTKEDVTAYLLENTKGVTVVMVTHDIDEANALGAKVLNLKDGKITN
ncbi:MAG: ABC transporter ATP-binding protein [Oscillospiraceae bacterium]|nr:ABC transporter ATP-binding protein [Oscillospiraceae bacterium]